MSGVNEPAISFSAIAVRPLPAGAVAGGDAGLVGLNFSFTAASDARFASAPSTGEPVQLSGDDALDEAEHGLAPEMWAGRPLTV